MLRGGKKAFGDDPMSHSGSRADVDVAHQPDWAGWKDYRKRSSKVASADL